MQTSSDIELRCLNLAPKSTFVRIGNNVIRFMSVYLIIQSEGTHFFAIFCNISDVRIESNDIEFMSN
jgi:hypothetical protein